MTDFLKIAKSIVVHFAHIVLTALKRLNEEVGRKILTARQTR